MYSLSIRSEMGTTFRSLTEIFFLLQLDIWFEAKKTVHQPENIVLGS
jgi:hypothetical protein